MAHRKANSSNTYPNTNKQLPSLYITLRTRETIKIPKLFTGTESKAECTLNTCKTRKSSNYHQRKAKIQKTTPHLIMTTVLLHPKLGRREVVTTASFSTLLFLSPSQETGPNPLPEPGAMTAATIASTDIGKASETRIIKGMCKLCRNPSITISSNKQEKRHTEQLKLLVINQSDLGSNTLDNRDHLLIVLVSSVSQIAIFRVYQPVSKPNKSGLKLRQRLAKIYSQYISH